VIVSIVDQDSISVHLDESTVEPGALIFRGPEDFEEKFSTALMDRVRAQLLDDDVPTSPSVAVAATRFWVTLSMAYRPFVRPEKVPKPVRWQGERRPLEALWCPYGVKRDRVEEAARRLLSYEGRAFLDALAKSTTKYHLPEEAEAYVVKNASLRHRPGDVSGIWKSGLFLQRGVGSWKELVWSGLLKKVPYTEYVEAKRLEALSPDKLRWELARKSGRKQ
jgi:hypothetical protein